MGVVGKNKRKRTCINIDNNFYFIINLLYSSSKTIIFINSKNLV